MQSGGLGASAPEKTPLPFFTNLVGLLYNRKFAERRRMSDKGPTAFIFCPSFYISHFSMRCKRKAGVWGRSTQEKIPSPSYSYPIGLL
jgi:hypothetical protein